MSSGACAGTGAVQVAVVGAGDDAGDLQRELAEEVGRRLAEADAILVCGGRGGVMEAASRGARLAGGLVVGILPGQDAADSPPNPHLSAAIYTGIGQARNLAVVLSGRSVVAIGGGWGTLSEIALALRHGRRVVTLDSWWPERDGVDQPAGLLRARNAEEAVCLALEA